MLYRSIILNGTDVVNIYVSNAFDSIVFSKLLTELKQLGIVGKLYSYVSLSCFIHAGSQRVLSQNCFSAVADML